jgi:hypothetical protein
MNREERRQLIDFNLVLSERTNGIAKSSDVEQLLKLSRQHLRLQEAKCNRPWTMSDETKETKLRERATAIIESWGFKALFTGDPRGYTLRILFPDGKYNTWGGVEDGYGVPTS